MIQVLFEIHDSASHKMTRSQDFPKAAIGTHPFNKATNSRLVTSRTVLSAIIKTMIGKRMIKGIFANMVIV
jgi:hypothetical protein